MPDTRKCLAHNCRKRISTEYLMCPRHWAMLPFSLQQEVCHTNRSGNVKAYRDAVTAACEHIKNRTRLGAKR